MLPPCLALVHSCWVFAGFWCPPVRKYGGHTYPLPLQMSAVNVQCCTLVPWLDHPASHHVGRGARAAHRAGAAAASVLLCVFTHTFHLTVFGTSLVTSSVSVVAECFCCLLKYLFACNLFSLINLSQVPLTHLQELFI